MRQWLQSLWTLTVGRVASLELARPAPIPLTTAIGRPWPYLTAAVRACAPGSTLAMTLSTIAAAVCHIGQSQVLGTMTTRALQGATEAAVQMLALLFALWMSTPLMNALKSLAMLYSSQNLRIGVTDHLTARLMHARPVALAANAVGNLVERVELASNGLQSVVGSLAETAVKLVTVAVLSTWILWDVSVPLALGAAAWMGSALLLSSYLAYTGMNIVEDASDAHARVIADLAEIVTNVPLIRAFVTQRHERRRFARALDADLLACRQVRSYWVFVLLLETLYKWLFGAAVALYAASAYASGSLGLAELVTVCSLVISLSWHFESVAFHFVDLFDAAGVLRASLREIDAVPVDGLESGSGSALVDDAPPALPRAGALSLHGVSAGYGEERVLRDVSFTVPPGAKVAIVGPSGSGKSTVLALVRGDLAPRSGRIDVHGLAADELPPARRARTITEAQQSALMFNRSVMENVVYGGPGDARDRELARTALRHAEAAEVVDRLPRGIDAEVGERGASLSTGERQRLGIARALTRDAPLILLDEATSSVDAISEARILDHLLTHTPGRTLIAVSHRVATLGRFDLVVLMAQGRVVDVGAPAELAARCPLYQQLLRSGDDDVPARDASPPATARESAEV